MSLYKIKKIHSGKYYVNIGDNEYTIYNHGYYHPDKQIWWEACNLKTGEADFHSNTKRNLLKMIVEDYLERGN